MVFLCRGDVLIFLTGQDEIESAVRTIRDIARNVDQDLPKLSVLPLYAALPSHLQLRVFEPAPPVRNFWKMISFYILFTWRGVGGGWECLH